tara:strand:+ start:1594 stop:2331 length:738 start_codon:yes stop_codon:yes gene_type:complete
MLSKEELNEMEEWVLGAFPTRKCDNFSSNKFKKRMKDRYGLKLVAEDGVSRTVYKRPYSREVVKFTYFIHNIAEHEVWKAYKDSDVAGGLAACYQASKGGMVLTQEYMSRSLPHDRTYTDSWHGLYWGKEFGSIKAVIGNVFANSENDAMDVEDFHQSNMMYNAKGKAKIVDYASVAECLTASYYITFAKTNAQRIRREIAKALKKGMTPDKSLAISFHEDTLYVATDMQYASMRLSIEAELEQD